ncbi:MAG TPA: flagellar assembly protein FliX [Acetobacteraceae bacterium]|nr:flagellar assembly protein FliX [Acetobacteraceae bacterium]
MTGGIDRVSGYRGTGAAAAVGRGREAGAAGGAFRVAEGGAQAPAAGGIGASETAGLLGVMLALQEAGVERPRDRAARRHGEAMLAELRALQLALLDGVDGAAGEAALERLAGLAERMPEAADAGLQAALGWVALRARIELARRRVGENKTA